MRSEGVHSHVWLSGLDVVGVKFDVSGEGENLTRKFGDERFGSRQFAGRGGRSTCLQAFRPADVRHGAGGFRRSSSLILRRWSLLGLPLSMWLGPRAESDETRSTGRFNFHVRMSHLLTGLIIRYDGWLVR